MARTNNLTDFLTDVSSAIKQKTGDSSPIPASEFDTEILSIETAGNYQSKTLNITQNGNYNLLPDQEFDAISNVNISVSVSPVLQNKTITENGSYTADQDYDGLGTVIVNVPQTGDVPVKLFETEEEMQADTTAEEGDLAVVYRNEVKNATVDSQFQTATFPDTVVLDNAITDSVEVRYRAVDSSVMFDCWGSLDSSMFRMDCYTETGSIRIRYTSEDGITYTRTDPTGNPVDFGTEIYYERAEYWNDAIGKFIQVGGSTFGGLFVGESIIKQIQPIKMSTMTINAETGVPNISDVITLNYNVNNFAEKIYPMVKYIDTLEGMNSHSRYPYCIYLKDNNTVSIIADGSSSSSVMLACPVFVNNTFKGLVAASYNVPNFYEWQFNLSTGEYIGRNDIVATDYTTFGSSTSKYYYTTEFNDYYYIGNMDWTGNNFNYLYSLLYNNTSNSANTLAMTGIIGIVYFLAPTQLTLNNPNELLPGKIGYGKNGVVTGDESIYDNLDKEQVFKTFTNINTPTVEDSSDLNRYKLYSVAGDFDTISGYRKDTPIYLAKTNMLDDIDYIVGIKSKLVTPKDIAILYKSVKGIDIVVKHIITMNDNIICTAVDVDGNKYLLKINSDNTELLSETTIECSSLNLVSYNNVGALVYTDSTTAKSYLIDVNGNEVEIPYVTTIGCYTPDGYLGFVTNSTNSVLYLYNPNTKTINTVGTVNYYNTSNYQGYVSGMMFYNFSDAIYVVCTIQDKKSSVYMYGRYVWKYTKVSNTSVSVATMDYSANTSGCNVYGGMCQETCLLSNNVIYDYKKGYYCTLSNSVSVYTGRHAGHITMYLDSEKTNRLYNPYSNTHDGIYLDTDVVLTYSYDAYKLNKAPSLSSIDLTPYSPTCVITLDATKIATGLNKFNYSAIGISVGSINEETGAITYNNDYYEFNYTNTRRIQTLTNFYEDGYYCSSKWDLYYFKESDKPEYVLLKTGFIKDNYSFAPSTKLLPLSVNVQLKPNYDNTISPTEYNTAVDTANEILG
jgi:hypothetical protein